MIFNASVLNDVASDSGDRWEILKEFLSETRSDIAKLNDAIIRHDFPSSVRLAHCIKGASSMIGADELAKACAQVEQAARNNLQPVSVDVQDAFCRLFQYITGTSGDCSR
jgi:HPt (histidine-containing phosphotransfer) domain-containing protein